MLELAILTFLCTFLPYLMQVLVDLAEGGAGSDVCS